MTAKRIKATTIESSVSAVRSFFRFKLLQIRCRYLMRVGKASKSNIQHPEKLQYSNPKRRMGPSAQHVDQPRTIEAWNLELLWSLDVEAWSFSFHRLISQL